MVTNVPNGNVYRPVSRNIKEMTSKTQVATRIDEDLLARIKEIEKETRADRAEVIRRLLDEGVKQYRLDKAIAQLREGKVTISKAAETADVSVWEMVEIMRSKQIPIPYTVEDLRKSLELV